MNKYYKELIGKCIYLDAISRGKDYELPAWIHEEELVNELKDVERALYNMSDTIIKKLHKLITIALDDYKKYKEFNEKMEEYYWSEEIQLEKPMNYIVLTINGKSELINNI